MTHNDHKVSDPQQMLVWATGFSLLLLALASQATAQSPAPPVQEPSTQQTPVVDQKDSASKPGISAKPKKVITNEDLEPRSAGGQAGATDKMITGGTSSLLNCDATCEQQARELLEYGPDHEAEWQLQVVRARRDLIADTEWRGMLGQSIDQVRTYYNFLAQQSQKTSPSGNSWDAQVQRARNNQYFENMGNTLRQGLDATVKRMENRMQDVGALSPVRAAMMNVEANRIFDRTCAELPHR